MYLQHLAHFNLVSCPTHIMFRTDHYSTLSYLYTRFVIIHTTIIISRTTCPNCISPISPLIIGRGLIVGVASKILHERLISTYLETPLQKSCICPYKCVSISDQYNCCWTPKLSASLYLTSVTAVCTAKSTDQCVSVSVVKQLSQPVSVCMCHAPKECNSWILKPGTDVAFEAAAVWRPMPWKWPSLQQDMGMVGYG